MGKNMAISGNANIASSLAGYFSQIDYRVTLAPNVPNSRLILAQ